MGCFFSFHFSVSLFAQVQNPVSAFPLDPSRSVLFGKDVIISDEADQNQRNIAICSAFNGWLYAAYWYPITIFNEGFLYTRPVIKIHISTDYGMNWTELTSIEVTEVNKYVAGLKIVTTGQTNQDIKIIIGYRWTHTDDPHWSGKAIVARYNGITGAFEDIIFQSAPGIEILDIALASDVNYPAEGANPNSLALLLSKLDQWVDDDSITVYTSSNGGMSFDGHKSITGYSNSGWFRRVSLAYGFSPTCNNGTYYACWEKKAPGFRDLYVAHSTPNFDSPFTSPVRIDSLDPATTSMCRNPAISCQYSNTNNDSSNLTEVIVFEKYLPDDERWELAGCYNLQSASSSHFHPFSVSAGTNILVQPDICFNDDNSKFYLAYYDSTGAKLPLLEKDVNMADPSSWTVVSPDYHDLFTLSAPAPQVSYNFGKQDVVNVWTSKRSNGNKAALFDAPYSTYTAIHQNATTNNKESVIAYPNPCSFKINFSFNLSSVERIQISLYNLLGQQIKVICDKTWPSGEWLIAGDIASVPNGSYFYVYQSDKVTKAGKIQISK